MKYVCIVVDHNSDRKDAISARLSQCLTYPVEKCDGWDAVQGKIDAARNRDAQVQLVVMPFDLPGKGEIRSRLIYRLGALFTSMAFATNGRVVVIQDHPGFTVELPDPNDQRVIVWQTGGQPIDLNRLADQIAAQQAYSLPTVSFESDDAIFQQQREWLNPSGYSNGASLVLANLIFCFRNQCRAAAVGRLTQGFSGSLVLCVDMELMNGTNSKVLMKISNSGDMWKARRMADNWETIDQVINSSPMTKNAPKLHRPDQSSLLAPFLVEASDYYAEFWDFIGDIADWGEVYCKQTEGLPDANSFVKDAIDLLSRSFYQDHSWSERKMLWDGKDAEYPGFPEMPPYRLTPWWRATILSALDGFDQLGKRFDQTCWQQDQSTVESWLTDGPPPNSVARSELPVLMSMVHGDLNKGNILWWLNENRPLFIDFATFREKSHTLQDFADLETEILFALMDREESSSVTALDFAHEQFQLWLDRLNHLVPVYPESLESFSQCDSTSQTTMGYRRAEELVALVRREAHQLHTAAVEESELGHLASSTRFSDEYAAAMLFPTLQAIGYGDSLSPFKRLLAVHCAARLIRRLNVDRNNH